MDSLTPDTRHLATRVERPARDVYAFASNPANLPAWAAGLAEGIAETDGRWIAESSLLGRVEVVFAPANEFGVLDHDVTLPTGETVPNPVRVIPDGPAACDVVFTLRRRAHMTDAEFRRDAATVTDDLGRLKHLLEGRRGEPASPVAAG
ncbi:SRPBCC family protein [Streptomyces hainanensis]|uniref:SRPBCC family protein n=1 Tax=Streptomyces hainanensis TaxID=402648 RepID=A0A4R4SL61_9ACTN|nr:SRPBCC family protein [Streptomyces hainanensis]TDC63254.1 SRPBCC family protein [Streptomyces hainanensis]